MTPAMHFAVELGALAALFIIASILGSVLT